MRLPRWCLPTAHPSSSRRGCYGVPCPSACPAAIWRLRFSTVSQSKPRRLEVKQPPGAAQMPRRHFAFFCWGPGPESPRERPPTSRPTGPALRLSARFRRRWVSSATRRKIERIVAAVNATQPDVLLVGFGAPKQELWVHAHAEQLQAKVALCIGATIDFLAGEKRRAPRWMRRIGLEWLHRMSTEPRRLAKRVLARRVDLPAARVARLARMLTADILPAWQIASRLSWRSTAYAPPPSAPTETPGTQRQLSMHWPLSQWSSIGCFVNRQTLTAFTRRPGTTAPCPACSSTAARSCRWSPTIPLSRLEPKPRQSLMCYKLSRMPRGRRPMRRKRFWPS